MARRMILVLLVVLVAACSPTPSPTVSPSPSAQPSSSQAQATVQDSVAGMTFERPSAWVPWQPNLSAPINGGPSLYLSTDPLLPTCAVAIGATPNPPDADGQACQWPLTTLSADGVFVEWLNERPPSFLPSTGEPVEINGTTARIQSERPGSCAAIGADETMSVQVPTSASNTMPSIGVVACLRGPDLATSEAQVRAMLASIATTP